MNFGAKSSEHLDGNADAKLVVAGADPGNGL